MKKLNSKNLLIGLLKLRFGTITAQPPDSFPGQFVQRLAILVQERIGDTILLTPLLRHLRRILPESEITLIGVREFNEILRHDPHINHFYQLNRLSRQGKRRLYQLRFDVIFNSKDHPSFTFLYLTRKIKARWRVGLDHPGHRGFFDFLLPIPIDTAMAEKNGAILDLLGTADWRRDLRPYFTPGPVSPEIESFALTLPGSKAAIGINLSASNEYKSWKSENFRLLLKEINQPVIVFCMPDKLGEKRQLERDFHQVIPSPPTETIYDLAFLVQRLKLLVTPDTSLVHLASCYDIPVVALYRARLDYCRFPPYSRHQRVLITPGERTDEISPAEVLAAYRSIREEIDSEGLDSRQE